MCDDPLTVLTWNTLAPVYFYQDDGRRDVFEAFQADFARARGERLCAAIRHAGADVICLQEHWFEPSYQQLFQELAETCGYSYAALRRTGWNRDGRSQDGVAILTRSAALRVEGRHDIHFHDYGIPQDRVALLVRLLDVRAPAGVDSPSGPRQLAVLCTHLTFPHSCYEMASREDQIEACLHGAESALPRGIALLVVGDLNGPSDDSVGQILKRANFLNAWEAVHRRPCCITHRDHRGDDFASDHIWWRGPLLPGQALLLPAHTPDTVGIPRPRLGGAAQGPALPLIYDDWCQLSDHRPLLATFTWAD